MDLFELDDDECFDERCGEIFLTTKGNITFHCTLCEKMYNNFEAYAIHLLKSHLRSVKILEGTLSIDDCISMDAEDIVSIVKTETNTPENAKEKLPIEDFELVNSNVKDDSFDLESIKSPNHSQDVITSKQNSPKINNCSRKTSTTTSGKKPKQKESLKDRNKDCLECRKGFKATIDDRLHTCQRSFQCHLCNRSFLSSSHLHRHLRRHKNQRDFICEICDKAFYDRSTLKRHMKRHSTIQLNTFKCDVCTSTFSKDTDLENHMKIHDVEQEYGEYGCSVCEVGFDEHAGLFIHIKSHR